MTLSQTYISRKQLLVDNLVAKGVTGYTVNDGLTTLINAVLEIQRGGVRTLTLTADKSILSYYDEDTATLTATLLEGGEPVANEYVEFFTGSTSLGTAVTDSNGVATKTYTSQGIGDITLSAKVGSISSETYEVQDCTYWNSAEVSRTTTQGSTIYDSNMAVALPSKCEISMDICSIKSGGNGEHRYFLMPKTQYSSGTTQPSYALYFNYLTERGLHNWGKRENSTSVSIKGNLSSTIGDYYNVKWVIDGTTVQLYYDDVLDETATISWIGNYSDYTVSMMRWSAGGTSKIKNVKIKAL